MFILLWIVESDQEDDRQSEGGKSDDSAWVLHEEVSSEVILGYVS